MGSYRTSSLFHYTKRIDILYRILEEGLIPNYCYEDLSYGGHPEYGIGVPMVSFCDIPLSKIGLFVERYGQYAIGLTKQWATNKRINPILYAKDENILVSLGFYKSIERHYLEELKKYGGNENQVSIDLKAGTFPQLVAFFNRINAHSANQSIYGMTKKYYGNHDGQTQINYEENEWRYIVGDTENTPWFWSKARHDAWRGDRDSTHKPEPTEFLIREKLKFTAHDIAFIIVSKDEEIIDMVSFISSISRIADTKISDSDKLILCTRIISLERIQKDF